MWADQRAFRMRQILGFAVVALAIAAAVPQFMGQIGASPPASKPPSLAAAPAKERTSLPGNSRSLVLSRDRNGHFMAEGTVDGRRMSFVVDTGASVIALTRRDAARLGLHPAQRDFTAAVKTANGTVRAAPVELGRVDVGGVTVRDVRALVLPEAALSENLLGMSFLARLRRFEYRDGRLVLEQ